MNKIKLLLLLLLVTISPAVLLSQKLYFKVNKITQPCYKDGEIDIDIVGGKPPYILEFCSNDTFKVHGLDTITTMHYKHLSGYRTRSTAAIYVSELNGTRYGDTIITFSNNILVGIVVTNETCPKHDGSIELNVTGGTWPYTYLWNDSKAQTTSKAVNLKGGSYRCIVKDKNGCGFEIKSGSDSCGAIDTAGITVLSINTVNATNSITKNICGDDSVFTVTGTGGVSPYSYKWDNGKGTSNKLKITAKDSTYSVTVTDNVGCDNRLSYTPQINRSSFALTSKITEDSCNRMIGTISLTPAGGKSPYTYKWDNGQTTAKITGLKGGYYYGYAVDARGCSSGDYYSVPEVDVLQASFTEKKPYCADSSGTLSVAVTKGKPAYSYKWSTGATGNKIINLVSNYYHVSVSDQLGCNVTFSYYLNRNNPLTAQVQQVRPSYCGATDGGLKVYNIKGSSGTVKYYWYGNNRTYNGAFFQNLEMGYYYVQLTDSLGCTFNSSYDMLKDPDSCDISVSGSFYGDLNKNNTFDGSDYPYTNAPAFINYNGHYEYFSSGGSGNYSFTGRPAGNYRIAPLISAPEFWTLTTPAAGYYSYLISAKSVKTNQDFIYQTSKSLNNLAFENNWRRYSNSFRTGFTSTYQFQFRNLSTVKKQGFITLQYDTALEYIGSSWNKSDIAVDPTKRVITLKFYNLNPLQDKIAGINFKTATWANPGYKITFMGKLDTVAGDDDTTNNYLKEVYYVVGSYDPNYKKADHEGLTDISTQTLNYTVHFQNTGNHPADFVIIRDTLDANLALETVKVLGGSHPFKADLIGNALQIVFKSINLPDSNTDKAGSQGYIVYSADLKKNLSVGTKIRNRASIYFDYNAPVLTKSVLTQLAVVNTKQFAGSSQIRVSPNPSNGNFHVMMPNIGECQAEIFDEAGRAVWSKTLNSGGISEINISNLPAGIYLLKVNNSRFSATERLIIQQ